MDEDLRLDDVRYVVVDVETTGGTSGEHRIIELGFCVIEDGVVVRRYESLVNPHQTIPDFIVTMTGITNEMVATAPDEDDVIRVLAAELQDERTVFVGHNVGFDWGFVRAAMDRQGEHYHDVVRFCTCKFSRRISVGLPRHDLASVAAFYNVPIHARHRALGDAEATAYALLAMIDIARRDHEAATLAELVALQYAPRTVPRKEVKARELLDPYLRELPDEPGVYYFLSAKKKVLYIGKAKSLAKRVRSYFSASPLHSRKVARMIRYIRHIRWETTGTELGAMLLESREIKQHLPAYNGASLTYANSVFIRISDDAFPRFDLVHRIDDDGAEYFGPFRSQRMAERLLAMVQREHQLRSCAGTLVPSPTARPCFDFHVRKCLAPCAELQSAEAYRLNVDRARSYLVNIEQGAIGQLRRQMEECALRMDFERAALLRDGIREIERMSMHQHDRPMAVRDTNVILVVPTDDQYRTAEIFFLRAGRLILQRIVGRKAPVDMVRQAVYDVYGPRDVPTGAFSDRELDELRIITSWLHHHRQRASVVVVRSQGLDAVLAEVTIALRGTPPDEPADAGEYSQIPSWDVST